MCGADKRRSVGVIMRISIPGLIRRLESLRVRLNDLYEFLEDNEQIETEELENFFSDDDTFNLAIATDVLEQADKLDRALEIIKKYPFIVHHILKGTTYYDLQHEMPYTELPTEEEYDLLKEVLL